MRRRWIASILAAVVVISSLQIQTVDVSAQNLSQQIEEAVSTEEEPALEEEEAETGMGTQEEETVPEDTEAESGTQEEETASKDTEAESGTQEEEPDLANVNKEGEMTDGTEGAPAEDEEEIEIEVEPTGEMVIAAEGGGNIAEGTYTKDGSDVSWFIDAGGKLTVEGHGEFASPDRVSSSDVPWNQYKDDIVSAEINVTGMTNASYMFAYCRNLTNVDLSGFDTSKVTKINNMFMECDSLTSLDLSGFNTGQVTSMYAMFFGCDKLEDLKINSFDTSQVTDMTDMFGGCSSLTSLDISSFDTGKVTKMTNMFKECSKLEKLDISNLVTGRVTDMSYMFYGCSSLTNLDLSKFNTSQVTNMRDMFHGCSSLTSLVLSNLDTSHVTNMADMFNGCSSLTSLDVSSFDTSQSLILGGMFNGCSGLTSLDINNFNTSQVALMGRMFSGCSGLTSLDISNFNTSRVTTMEYMFDGCSSLASLDLSNMDTSQVTHMNHMFSGCSSLTSLDLSNMDTSQVIYMTSMFSGCSNLKSLDLNNFDTGKVVDVNCMFQNCSSLTSLDLSSLDVSQLHSTVNEMFDGCSSLTMISTPYNLSQSVELPINSETDIWYSYDQTETATEITELPKDLSYSIVIMKNDDKPTTYPVSFNGTGANDIAEGTQNRVVAGANYKFTLAKQAGYVYSVTAVMGGESVTPTADRTGNTYTISNVNGELAITIEKKEKSTYEVTFKGTGAEDIAKDTPVKATEGEDYIFTLVKEDGYSYTVTATMGENAITPIADKSGNTYTIQNVTDNLEITIEKTVDQNPGKDPEIEEDKAISLILDETEKIMQIGDKWQVTATTVPENSQVTWDSSNEAVAAVSETGEITAKAEGHALITAMCDDLDAVIKVEVAPADSNDKLVDLTGDIWVAGFQRESEDFVYSGQKITQNIRIYHKNTLLKEKTDYTLSYKNNINAAAYYEAKAPSVTINLKGQYSGSVTLYYTIKPLDINNIDANSINPGDSDRTEVGGNNSPGYEQTVNYSKNLKIPSPALTFGKKKLAMNKDFACDYTPLVDQLKPEPGQSEADYKNGDLYEPDRVYNYTVNGIGNFKGSFQMQLVVLKDKGLNFGSASVTLGAKQYEYHGEALSKTDVTISQVKISGQILDPDLYTYEVCARAIEGAYVMVYPSSDGRDAGYRGCKKVSLKLVGDRNIGDADVVESGWQPSIAFSQKTVDKYGGIFQAKTGILMYETEEATELLTEGEDYTVKYSNAKKVGKVTVTFTGKGRYKGSLKKTYEISPVKEGLKITWGENVTVKGKTLEVAYQKGGAIPDFIIRDSEHSILKNKTDYTVKFKDNKEPGTDMRCEITGKGNYKGYTDIVSLKVKPGDIGQATISIPDKPYSAKQNAWKSSVTLKDVNGKKLVAGTDYKKEIEYIYEGKDSEQLPEAGTTVTVTVYGKGCYEGSSITEDYRIYENNISKLKIVIDPQEYTGEEITLSKDDIHVYLNSADAKKETNEIKESCYYIAEYKNNIKAGTAKVTLHGIGNYGGTKTYSFKIQKKVYQINRVTGIKLDKTSLAMRLAEKKTRLTAKITPEDVSNPIIIWSTSNSNIATVETDTVGGAVATVVLKKEGTVTITAVTQDGNKKAQCKITIVDVPILQEADQTIEGEVGDTYQLNVIWEESQVPDPEKLKWESNNSDKVSVDKNGLVTMKETGAAVITMQAGTSAYVQQCYVVVKGEETLPEGKVLTYRQTPGCEDDTPYINKLLREWETAQKNNWDTYDYMYIPAGVYRIDPVAGGFDEFGAYKFGGIVLTENQTLIMSPSALLVAIGNSSEQYHVIYAFNRVNVTISGGQIIGERKEHKGKNGEWGHGISIQGCTNVHISDVEVSQCWGDGIYIGFYDGPNKSSNDVTIENCNLHHNRRNNLSITDASNVNVRNSQFNYANGTNPQYGIDIEPNSGRTCSNVTISDCKFQGNAKGTIQILGQLNAHVKGVKIENCTGDKAPAEWSGFGGSVSGVTYKNNKWN